MTWRSEFGVHKLNQNGMEKAKRIATVFTNLLDQLEDMCGSEGREMAIARTKLEEACFFSKKAMARREENQDAGQV